MKYKKQDDCKDTTTLFYRCWCSSAIVLVQAAIMIPRLDGLPPTEIFFIVLEAENSKIKALADLLSGEDPLPGL